MNRFSIFFLLIGFLLFTEASAAEQKSPSSLALKIKRGAEHSKDFALSKDTGNLLLFALSAGFLIYLPRHLSKSSLQDHFVDAIIKFPKKHLFSHVFGHADWAKYLYYEILTLLAGYICAKTGKPYWEKFKQS